MVQVLSSCANTRQHSPTLNPKPNPKPQTPNPKPQTSKPHELSRAEECGRRGSGGEGGGGG